MGEVHNARGSLPVRPLGLLAISGSLRQASFSTALLKALSQEEFPNIAIAVRTLEGIPLYNEDLDTEPALRAIAEMRAAVSRSDGVVIASPEYNHGIPGVLKNALDWASRPAFESCFRNKPVLILTSASGATGGVRAQYQLRETLASMLAYVVPVREILLGGVENRVQDGKITDRDTLRVLTKGIDALRKEILNRLALGEGA